MSLEGFRVPLQEQKLEVNTPFHKNINPKITTPPGSSFMSKNHPNSMGNYYNPSHYDHNDDIDTSLTMETPVKTYDINRNLLLSPAFSSPQNFNNHFYNHDNVQKPPQMQSHLQPQYQEIQTTDIQQIQQQQQQLQQNYQMNLQNDSAQHNTVGISDIEKKRKKSKPKKAFDFQSSDKPPYSYATLIGLSILSHPEKRLTLSSIYQWISDTFKYYKREDVGWQNSIRHNLSLNKAFIKGEKSKDGKGHFWCIQNGFEDQFLKSRNNKNGSYHEIMEQINQNSRKASINSIPSSPNYYDINSSIMSNDKLDESFNSQTTVEDNHKKDDEKHQDNEEQEDKENFQSNKRQKTELGEPFIKTPKQSVTSATFENIKSMSTPSFDLINSTPKLIVTESPNKPLVASKNLTFTSSFSCNSNLELSPIRPNETGPLLEPLTPGRIYKNGAVNHHLSINYQNQPINNAKINFDKVFAASTIASSTTTLSKVIEQQTHQQQQQLSTQPQYQPQQPPHHQAPTHLHPDHNDTIQKFNGLRTPKNNIKTPLRILKTPNTSFKKFWNSPNYLDDFYYSPLITSNSALHSYDDDDMILRAFESPANNQKVLHKRKLSNSLSKN